jgi:hypothetical protein
LIVEYNVVDLSGSIELLPYLQCVAITETKDSLDELVTFNYMYTIYFKYRTFLKKRFTCMLDIMSYTFIISTLNIENFKKKRRNEPTN